MDIVSSRDMKRVALTGATSMLGAALIDECILHGIRVLAIINPGSLNVGRIPQSDFVKVVECKLEELNKMPALDEAYDTFYHFGWTGTSKVNRLNVDEQTRNIEFTLDAVRLAKRIGCHTFIGAGSQAEYGRVSAPKISPDTPVNPDIAYGVAKYAAGKQSGILCEQLKMRHIWMRIFSVYGPNDHDKTMIMQCIHALLIRQKPSFTKCEQTWDFIFSEDAARAFRLIGEKGHDRTTYCVGSGIARPLIEYILAIRDYIDPKLPIGIGDLPYASNQIMNLCADISNLQRDTGFSPIVEFRQGIEKTINILTLRS